MRTSFFSRGRNKNVVRFIIEEILPFILDSLLKNKQVLNQLSLTVVELPLKRVESFLL